MYTHQPDLFSSEKETADEEDILRQARDILSRRLSPGETLSNPDDGSIFARGVRKFAKFRRESAVDECDSMSTADREQSMHRSTGRNEVDGSL